MTKMLEFSCTLSSLYSTSNVQIVYSSENANVENYKTQLVMFKVQHWRQDVVSSMRLWF